MGKRQHKYIENVWTKLSPELIEPIKVPARPTPKSLSEGAEQQFFQEVKDWEESCARILLEAKIRKLKLLQDAFDISSEDPERWFKLSMALAEDFIPGFEVRQVSPKAAKNKKWHDHVLFELYLDVKTHREAKGCSIREACMHLSHTAPWNQMGSWEILRQRYNEAQKHWLIKAMEKLNP